MDTRDCPELFAVSALAFFFAFVSISVTAAATPDLAGASAAARCAELSERLGRLHAEVERLRSETAMVEAQLVTLCVNPTNLGHPLFEMPTGSGATVGGVSVAEHIAPRVSVENRPPARRSGTSEVDYAVHCWAPNSTFTDPSCNCLGRPAHPKLGSRLTIKLVLPSWYVHCPRHGCSYLRPRTNNVLCCAVPDCG